MIVALILALVLALQAPVVTSKPEVPFGPAEPSPPTCELPPVAPRTRLIVGGFYEGAAVSTVAIAGQDEETTVADLEIEPGRERLTLVLVGYDPMIYRFSGATRRVDRVIIVSRSGAGATGLPRSRVAFASSEGCDLGYNLYEPAGAEHAAPRLRALFGAAPDVVGGAYEVYRARLGSNGFAFTPSPRPARPMGGMEGELLRFYPAGIVPVRAADVVASDRAEPYAVLPSTAGIVQLMRAGALVAATERDVAAWLAAAGASGRHGPEGLRDLRNVVRPGALLATRPLRLPAQLCGAHSVTILVPRGGQVSGHPCHSTILYPDGSAGGPFARDR